MSGGPARIRVAAYVHPHRVGPAATGVGKHIGAMTVELAARPGVDLTLLAERRAWAAFRRDYPADPLAGLPAVTYGGRRAVVEKTWSLGGWPPAERWTGPVDWVYCPMEAHVPTRRARLAVTSHCLYWFDRTLPDLYAASRGDRLRWRVRIGRPLRDPEVLWLAVSEFLKGQLVEFFGVRPERVAVVGNGVEAAYYAAADAPPPAAGRPYLLAVGGLQYWKGADYLLALADRLYAAGSDLEVVVCGRHEPEWVARAGGRPNVRLIGYVGVRTGLPDLMAGSLAVLNLTRNDSFGIPAAEGMAAGTAVVVSDHSALPGVVADGGVCVRPDDPDAVHQAVARLVADPGFRAGLVARGRARAAEHTWQRCGDRLLAALRRG